MAYSGITATEAEIDQKSGANVDILFTDTMKTQSLLQAESYLNTETLFNWSDAFAGLNVDVKFIVTSVTASLVAIDAISYNFNTFSSLARAQMKINVLFDIFKRGIKTLREAENKTFVQEA